VTFSRPLTVEEFDAAASVAGVTTHDFEAIGAKDGFTWTYGGGTSSDAFARMKADGVAFSGFTYMVANLADEAAYRQLRKQGDVLLVDFAPALARQALASDAEGRAVVGSDTIDIVANDVYWEHAGITR
jgi:hypothetical protein